MSTAPEPSPRAFGLSVGPVLAILGGWGVYRGWSGSAVWTVLTGAGSLFFLLGLVAPAVLAPVAKRWARFAQAVGWVNTRILLALVYYGLVLPFGLVRRAVADPLGLRPSSAQSYWKRREASSDLDAYRRQV
jgi:hypothetical protein